MTSPETAIYCADDRSDGHKVTEAENGLKVLAILREQVCDLVLTDIMFRSLADTWAHTRAQGLAENFR